jgi:hypothetical protein
MAATASASHAQIPTHINTKDITGGLMRSPDTYSPITPQADTFSKSSGSGQISPRTRSELIERSRQQPSNRQQCRAGLKSPLYVPAVLRPTEKPTTPTTARKGDALRKDGIPGDDGWNRIPREETDEHGSMMTASAVDVAFRAGFDSPLAANSRIGITRVTSDELNEAAQGPVTGLPSTNHWKVSTTSLSDSLFFFSFTILCDSGFHLLTYIFRSLTLPPKYAASSLVPTHSASSFAATTVVVAAASFAGNIPAMLLH